MDLTRLTFLKCFELYDLFIDAEQRKKIFRTKREVCQSLEHSKNPSRTVFYFITDLLLCNVLLSTKDGIILDKKEFEKLVESSVFYRFIDRYMANTQAFHFSGKYVK